MTAPDMSAWLHAQTRRAQLKPRFDSLLQQREAAPTVLVDLSAPSVHSGA